MRAPAAALDRIHQIQDRADSQGRALFVHEAAEVDDLLAQLESGSGRQTGRDATRDTSSTPRSQWRNLGEFARAVYKASHPESRAQAWDPRLINTAPTSVGTEGVGQDGGFAVPPDFLPAISRKVFADDQLLQRCFQVPTTSNTISWPSDEVAPWDNSNGIRAYWDGEAQQLTQTKPKLQAASNRLHRLTALVPVTDELLEDAPGMATYLASRIPDALTQKINDAIIDGTGVGMPLGFLRSDCRIAVAKESSQAAATIKAQNIAKMWSRMLPNWRADAVWVAHSNTEPQLMSLAYQATDVANLNPTGAIPLYIPPGGFNNSPYAMILGKPVLIMQGANDLGTEGDITLFSPSQYLAAIKEGGMRTDVSIHLFFDYNVTAFRATFRMGGMPMWSSPVTAKYGSTTYSPIVTLATRA